MAYVNVPKDLTKVKTKVLFNLTKRQLICFGSGALIAFGRMIEIYLVTSVAPIPMATMMGKEWGGMGQNYIRSLLALGFQAFLIIVCVAIYAVLVQNIALVDDIIYAIWTCMGYTVLLCFCLFKTSSLAKSVFNAH